MQRIFSSDLTASLIKALAFAIGIVVVIWFLHTVISAVLLFFLAVVFAIIINAPVTWLEKKKIPRSWGTLLIFLLVFIVFCLFSWLIIPIAGVQLRSLIQNFPAYVSKIEQLITSWRAEYFHVVQPTLPASDAGLSMPAVTNTLLKIGGYSISILASFLLFLVMVSLTAYMVINPRPLLRLYLSVFPNSYRDRAQNVFVKTSHMLIGWMRANLIGGVIEGTGVIVFLNIMNVPGAWVWGVLAFTSQMIPKVGFYLMSVPPTLVALSISPLTALWVFGFFLIVDEILGDFIMPRLRSTSMNLHPVTIIFSLLVMGAAFGLIGIILSTPIAAFAKSFYEEFYLTRLGPDGKMEDRVDGIIKQSSAKTTP